MSDAAVDVFAEASEDDPIRLAVAAAMAKLASDVRRLPHIYDPAVGHGDDDEDLRNEIDRRRVLALIEKATP